MRERRSVRKELEARLRTRQDEVERLWRSYAEEAAAASAPHLAERLERRITWGLWAIALHEATALMDELENADPEPQVVAPWVCQSCRRRVLRLVESGEDLPASA